MTKLANFAQEPWGAAELLLIESSLALLFFTVLLCNDDAMMQFSDIERIEMSLGGRCIILADARKR